MNFATVVSASCEALASGSSLGYRASQNAPSLLEALLANDCNLPLTHAQLLNTISSN